MATGTEIDFFSAHPADISHLSSLNTGDVDSLSLGGTSSRNKISLRGSRFRISVGGGEEAVVDENYLDVIIVGGSKNLSRILYPPYDPKVKSSPLCISADNIVPHPGVVSPPSTTCAMCPMNQEGSRITPDGRKARACGFFKRLAVVPLIDPEHRVYQLDVKSLSLFGKSGVEAQGKFTHDQFSKKLDFNNCDCSRIVTRLSFDTKASVPKLHFSIVRWAKEEASWISALKNSEQKKTITEVTAASDGVGRAPVTIDQELIVEVEKTEEPKKEAVKSVSGKAKLPAPKEVPVVSPAAVVELEEDAHLLDFLSQLDSE